ncbi:hypothetical protein BDBG_17176 [Blastomyces gilchristii SLH14081]|uniref:Uncharacterized protein n=1 Tax=Blastomyces gilchristii (strain SLH14081) TaxID=559298 RepID=A0A179UMA3_BLAGS|nr:uncharacterized protein BDBG_17176 [Blastomyces gilchristii SLH14081]OAT09206.1 hypothetical protein BDBG_17176 [Blastomyces gilchristii SLH14081]
MYDKLHIRSFNRFIPFSLLSSPPFAHEWTLISTSHRLHWPNPYASEDLATHAARWRLLIAAMPGKRKKEKKNLSTFKLLPRFRSPQPCIISITSIRREHRAPAPSSSSSSSFSSYYYS